MYEQVLTGTQTTNDFVVSGTSLLLYVHGSGTATLHIIAPDGTAIEVATFTQNENEMLLCPPTTTMRISVTAAGSKAWVAPVGNSIGDFMYGDL